MKNNEVKIQVNGVSIIVGAAPTEVRKYTARRKKKTTTLLPGEHVGQRLVVARDRMGLNTHQVYKIISPGTVKSDRTLYNYEKGKVIPPYKVVRRLCKLYNVKLEEIATPEEIEKILSRPNFGVGKKRKSKGTPGDGVVIDFGKKPIRSENHDMHAYFPANQGDMVTALGATALSRYAMNIAEDDTYFIAAVSPREQENMRRVFGVKGKFVKMDITVRDFKPKADKDGNTK